MVRLSLLLRDRKEINATLIEEKNRLDFEDFSAAGIYSDTSKKKSSIDKWIFPSRSVTVIFLRSLISLCTATTILAQDSAPNEEIAMLKIPSHDSCSENGTRNSRKNHIAILEQQMQEVFTDTSLGDFGAKAASARPQIQSNRLFVKTDGFLWKAFIGGSDYAATDSTTNTAILSGNTKRADFRWRWGFRAELGYRLPHDHWDIAANYTWFHDKSDRTVAAPSGGTIAPLLYTPFILSAFSADASGSIRWHLHYQNFDLELRKDYFLSSHFSVSPFFGMRNTWLNQGYRVRYNNPNASIDNPRTIEILSKQDFWGIGPLVGLNTNWHITNQWWIFGSFISSLLASDYDIYSDQLNDLETENSVKANAKRMSPNVQGALGLGWHMNLNRQRNHIAVRLSYEAQYWWKQNLMIQYTNASPYRVARNGEDLGFHGFNLDMLFDF